MGPYSKIGGILVSAVSLFSLLEPIQSVELRVSSAPLVQARRCVENDGALDLLNPSYSAEDGVPRCFSPGICPTGTVAERQQCVAPAAHTDPVEVREIAITVHAACDNSCSRDRGLNIAGSLWLTFARLAGVPLHETAAAVMVLNPHLVHFCPLERFALVQPESSSPLDLRLAGALRSDTSGQKAFDVFVALRARTARVRPEVEADFQSLLLGNVWPLARLLTSTSGSAFSVYEASERIGLDADAPPVRRLEARFRFAGHGWGETPGIQCQEAAANGSSLWPPLDGSAWTSALADTRLTALQTIKPFRHPLRFVASETSGAAETWYVDEYGEEPHETILTESSFSPDLLLGIGALVSLCCFCALMSHLGVSKCLQARGAPRGKYIAREEYENGGVKYGKQSRVHPEHVRAECEPEEEPDEDPESPTGSASDDGPNPHGEGWNRPPPPAEVPPRAKRHNVRSGRSPPPFGQRVRRNPSQPQPPRSATRSGSVPPPGASAREERGANAANEGISPAAQRLVSQMMQRLDAAWGAPLEERKRVFRDLQRDLHPDKNMHTEEDAEAAKVAFQKLMERRAGFLLAN